MSQLRDRSVYPAEADLQPGDLIWCRARRSITVRDADPDSDQACYHPTTIDDWHREQTAFIRSVRADAAATREALDAAAAVGRMSLYDFLPRYQGAPSTLRQLDSQTPISTGHVAVIAVDATGRRLVVESTRPALRPPKTYEEWLGRFRKPFMVWQGRLQGVEFAPVILAEQARHWTEELYKGVPFSMWNFDLNDPSAFYCAKFVWMVVYRASGDTVGVDGDPNPKRGFLRWCTPRDILCSPYTKLVFTPAEF